MVYLLRIVKLLIFVCNYFSFRTTVTMETMIVSARDIPQSATVYDVIKMAVQYNVSDLGSYALFHVKNKKEKRIKSAQYLQQILMGTTESLVLTVKKRSEQAKCSKISKVKKTLMRLKSVFARDRATEINNLNCTKTRNLDVDTTKRTKCTGEKLTEIENLLQSETMMMIESQDTETLGKVALFRRFMNDVNDSISEATPDHTYNDYALSGDITEVSSEFNTAFILDRKSFLNIAIPEATLNQQTSFCHNFPDLTITDNTDLFNECMVLNDSCDFSETSESAFEDDDEIDDFERNIFDDDFEPLTDEIRNFFDKSRTESTDDAIDSFMNTMAGCREVDEGLSSLGSDCASE